MTAARWDEKQRERRRLARAHAAKMRTANMCNVAPPAEAAAGHLEDADAAPAPPAPSRTKAPSSCPKAVPEATAPSSSTQKGLSSAPEPALKPTATPAPPAPSPELAPSSGLKSAAPKVTASPAPSRKEASSSSPKSIQRAAVPASHALTTKNTMTIRAVWRDSIIGRRRTFVVCSGLKSLAKAKIQIYKLRDGGNYRRLH